MVFFSQAGNERFSDVTRSVIESEKTNFSKEKYILFSVHNDLVYMFTLFCL